eukprot:3292489-Rhodomonas_salina.1
MLSADVATRRSPVMTYGVWPYQAWDLFLWSVLMNRHEVPRTTPPTRSPMSFVIWKQQSKGSKTSKAAAKARYGISATIEAVLAGQTLLRR